MRPHRPEVVNHREARPESTLRSAVRLGSPEILASAEAHPGDFIRRGLPSMFDRTASTIANTDPELWAVIQRENQRQEDHIELIASENYASPAVMAAQGSQLTNKYAEGYPGKRYYGGCEFVDVVEQLAIDRVKRLFGAGHAHVPAKSGSQANRAGFFSPNQPG